MLGGALITLVAGVFTIIATLADPRLINNGKQPTSGALSGDIVQVVLLSLVYCALWVLMARMNRSGQVWARIVASVLFAISTYSLYAAINSLHAGEYLAVVNIISFILAVAEWVCGLGAVALLWRSESSVYFKARSARR
jgi:NADH:ubiquinone oxidoreductase subunit K